MHVRNQNTMVASSETKRELIFRSSSSSLSSSSGRRLAGSIVDAFAGSNTTSSGVPLVDAKRDLLLQPQHRQQQQPQQQQQQQQQPQQQQHYSKINVILCTCVLLAVLIVAFVVGAAWGGSYLSLVAPGIVTCDGIGKNSGGPRIFIAIISSRREFKSRIPGISMTWVEQARNLEGIDVRFFVGDREASDGIETGSSEDVADLAAQALLPDPSSIVVMKGVKDDEYPPVHKNVAMMKTISSIIEQSDDNGAKYDWIFKADDDTYINICSLITFASTKNPNGFGYWGARGFSISHGTLIKPYCTGGPGYLLTKSTLHATVGHFDECIRFADESQFRKNLWHSDVVIGMCITRATGGGCWESDEKYTGYVSFRHTFWSGRTGRTVRYGLSKSVSYHPLKGSELMLGQHKNIFW